MKPKKVLLKSPLKGVYFIFFNFKPMFFAGCDGNVFSIARHKGESFVLKFSILTSWWQLIPGKYANVGPSRHLRWESSLPYLKFTKQYILLPRKRISYICAVSIICLKRLWSVYKCNRKVSGVITRSISYSTLSTNNDT